MILYITHVGLWLSRACLFSGSEAQSGRWLQLLLFVCLDSFLGLASMVLKAYVAWLLGNEIGFRFFRAWLDGALGRVIRSPPSRLLRA